MSNAVLAFLSRDWAGMALAAMVASIGLFIVSDSAGLSTAWRVTGFAAVAVSAVMVLGAIRELLRARRVRKTHPAPGQRVDLGGHRIHVFAEGAASHKPTIVWLPGGHTGSFALHHLHRALRDEARSIMIDRPGTGWSDAGPFPRTTAGESIELFTALEQSGEAGPFLLVGHSFGGLLAVNMARRRPDAVAGVVLLDATPPDTIAYGPRLQGLAQMRTDALLLGLQRMFGIHVDIEARHARSSPEAARLLSIVRGCLGPEGLAYREAERLPGSAFASASIYGELTPHGLASVAWETVVYDGDLGQMPVWLVAPGDAPEVDTVPEIAAAGIDEQRRMQLFYARNRERYLAISSRSKRVYAPQGTGHNFPYEAPDCVVAVVREALGTTHAR